MKLLAILFLYVFSIISPCWNVSFKLSRFFICFYHFEWNYQKICVIKDIDREKALSNKTPALIKSTNMGIWVVGITNQLFKRDS